MTGTSAVEYFERAEAALAVAREIQGHFLKAPMTGDAERQYGRAIDSARLLFLAASVSDGLERTSLERRRLELEERRLGVAV